MKISASLFSKTDNLKDYIKQLEYTGVDCIHIDLLQSSEKTIDIGLLTKELSKIPFDVHIVNEQLLLETILAFNNTSTAYLSVQYENLKNKSDIVFLAEFNGLKGIAVTMDTPLDEVKQFFSILDFILIMCSTPGVSGAAFNEDNIERIRSLREKHPNLSIHVDGGIEETRANIMRQLGVTLCVFGSYLASSEGISLIDRMFNLYSYNPDLKALDIMYLRKNFEACKSNDDFMKILEHINKLQLGMTIVEDEINRFLGIITDGDIRRCLLRFKENVFKMHASDIVNRNAYTVPKNTPIKKILFDRIVLGKAISVIPVVAENRVIGLVDLNHFSS